MPLLPSNPTPPITFQLFSPLSLLLPSPLLLPSSSPPPPLLHSSSTLHSLFQEVCAIEEIQQLDVDLESLSVTIKKVLEGDATTSMVRDGPLAGLFTELVNIASF